jgi:hypothetical protein
MEFAHQSLDNTDEVKFQRGGLSRRALNRICDRITHFDRITPFGVGPLDSHQSKLRATARQRDWQYSVKPIRRRPGLFSWLFAFFSG